MIASPSDVPTEREIVRGVIAEWTAIHAADRSAVLLPVAWESHSAPEMGDRPQALINRRLLKDCDLLVAAFWTRIGSPTGHAESGTVEEIEEHISAKKETMIYFSQAPVRQDSVDSAQYESLKGFQERCKARGLYETYESLEEFREKLSRQLAITMIRIVASDPPSASSEVERESKIQPPPLRPLTLSGTAQQLLKAASSDKNGSFFRVAVMKGTIIQTSGHQLNITGNARDTARWDAAITELETAGLIRAASYKRESFNLTSEGYERADRLPVRPDA